MFFPEGQIRVFVYGKPVSMRLSYDGLYALAKHTMKCDPLSGNLFAFIKRRANQIKVLYFDRSGWCVWSKRLEYQQSAAGQPYPDRVLLRRQQEPSKHQQRVNASDSSRIGQHHQPELPAAVHH